MAFLSRKVFGHPLWAWVVCALWLALLAWGVYTGHTYPRCNSNGDCLNQRIW